MHRPRWLGGRRTPTDLTACDRLLTTTRSVRKRLDLSRPVERRVVEECLAIALQAPTGSNAQGWHFYVVTDRDKRKGIADLYKKAFDLYANNPAFRPQYAQDDMRSAQYPRVMDSARYLADHLHEVPVLVIPCVEGRFENAGVLAQASIYGSILPATWSLMLALRARGLGSAWTTLHLMYVKDAAKILGIPDTVTQTALLPVAHTKGGDFKPARRLPLSQVLHWDRW
jgi:nitroreductase